MTNLIKRIVHRLTTPHAPNNGCGIRAALAYQTKLANHIAKGTK